MAKSLTPFFTGPNPNSLYQTDSLSAVLSKARYVIDTRQGLTSIIGDIGFGKSTILRFLFSEYFSREDCNAILITMPNFPSPFSMLKSISEDFGIESTRSMQSQQKKFQQFLVAENAADRNVIVFIDEAQDLNNKQLDLLRALLNFETNTEKLIQIVIAGQVELLSILNRKVNKALKSRIITTSTLMPLELDEAREMIQKRCDYFKIANPFPNEILAAIHQKSNGVPRSILKICGFLYKMKEIGGMETIPVEYVDSALGEVAL
jgi:general secretion pathway protein A